MNSNKLQQRLQALYNEERVLEKKLAVLTRNYVAASRAAKTNAKARMRQTGLAVHLHDTKTKLNALQKQVQPLEKYFMSAFSSGLENARRRRRR